MCQYRSGCNGSHRGHGNQIGWFPRSVSPWDPSAVWGRSCNGNDSSPLVRLVAVAFGFFCFVRFWGRISEYYFLTSKPLSVKQLS